MVEHSPVAQLSSYHKPPFPARRAIGVDVTLENIVELVVRPCAPESGRQRGTRAIELVECVNAVTDCGTLLLRESCNGHVEIPRHCSLSAVNV
jgi:hypothetical protein